MVIQHNLTAMNSNRQLGITTGLQAKSTEKLSSGYRVNRAADDAAGLAISEKMRRQIRGLDQASKNVQDGISYVQVADAALAEIDDMLNRMTELCIQAANDTLTPTDREYIDAEIQQLKVECNRTFHTTTFNDKLIWDERTTDKKKVGEEDRPIFTWGASYKDVAITPANKAAWPANDQIDIVADTNGMKFHWVGCDGRTYESGTKAWPDMDTLETKGMSVSISELMNYSGANTAAKGIDYSFRLTKDVDVTLQQFVNELNQRKIYTSSSIGLGGNVKDGADLGISLYSGNITHYAGLVSKDSIFETEPDHIFPIDSDGNRSTTNRNADEGTSDVTFNLELTRNTNTTKEVEATKFKATTSFSGYITTYSDDRSAGTKNAWWYIDTNDHNKVKATSQTIYNTDLTSALNTALNGGGRYKSLVNDSSVGGYMVISFNITTDEGPQYKDTVEGNTSTGEALTNVGSFSLKVTVGANETAQDVLDRISDLDGIDFLSTYESQKRIDNGGSNWFRGNIYTGTMLINIQAGSEGNADNLIPLVYDVLNNHFLGINDVDSTSRENALTGVTKIKNAAQKVDEQRSVFGAYQNRMEHAHKNLDNAVENTQHSESVIRDTDMAAEMVKNSNNSILMQAGQAMLAQANQTNQGVMALLQ